MSALNTTQQQANIIEQYRAMFLAKTDISKWREAIKGTVDEYKPCKYSFHPVENDFIDSFTISTDSSGIATYFLISFKDGNNSAIWPILKSSFGEYTVMSEIMSSYLIKFERPDRNYTIQISFDDDFNSSHNTHMQWIQFEADSNQGQTVYFIPKFPN